MTGSIADYDALGRALDLYDIARETFADRPSEGNAAIATAELAWVDYRALRCGKPEDAHTVQWARARVKAYREMTTAGAHPTGAAVVAEVIGRIQEQSALRFSARRAR